MARARALCVTVLMLLALLPGRAAAQPGLPTVIQDDASLLDQPSAAVATAMRQIAAEGATWVRLSANWSVLAPDPASATPPAFDATDPSAYPQSAWAALDTAVRDAHADGLHVMIDAAYWAPLWATRSAPGPRARLDVNATDFADFAVALARRYSGSYTPPSPTPPPAGTPAPPPDENALQQLLGVLPLGSFASDPSAPDDASPLPAVDTLVLWNEPNFPAFLMPQWQGHTPVAADEYRAMVQAAYPAIKAVSPDLPVLIGNTAGSGGTANPLGSRPLAFIRELACVNARLAPIRTGACAHFTAVPGDGFADHPYSNQYPSEVSTGAERDNARIGDLPHLASLLNGLVARHRLAPRVRNIYITEYGFETQPPSGHWKLTRAQAEQQQSQVLTWAEFVAQQVPTVRMFAQFLLRDVPPGSSRVSDSPLRGFGQFYSGLQFADGQPKLSARTFREGLYAQVAPHGRVLLFGRLRLGAGSCRVQVQGTPAKGAARGLWLSTSSSSSAPAPSLLIGCQDSFVRDAKSLGSGARYRLLVHVGGRSGWQPGVAESAVVAPR